MQRENMSRSTFVKGIAATCIAACSLGALSSGEYSTKSGDSYTASAAGIESDVSVDVSGETPGVGADIGDEITQQILDAQSADIDGIAGATITSNAVKTALADALSQAGIDSGLESTTPAQGNAAETAGAESTTEAAESTTEAAAAEGTAETAAAAAGSYTPGTYTASAKGMDGDVPVTITIGDDGTITGVQVDVSGETAGIGAEIGDEVTKQILDAQSAEIDGVAGATVTSTAVKTAVADALAQASGAAAESATEAAAASQTEAAAAESTTESAAETETAATKPAAETEAQTETAPIYSYGKFTGTSGDASVTVTVKDGKLVSIEGLPEDTSKVTADVKAAARAALEKAGMDTVLYIPGTYTASAKGMDSDVTVTVTVDENKITDADIDVSGETQGIGATIGDTVRLQILSAQSDDIEGVSGATVSSAAVKKALADALDQASIAADDVPSNAENVTEAATE